MTDTIKISRELLERAATLLQDSLHPPAGCDSFDDWTAQGNALAAELRALLAAQPQASYKVPCKTHPDAPHGFCRNSSHTAGRYVCECEHWEEPQASAAQPAPAGEREAEAAAIAEEIDWLIRQWDAKASWSGERMAELLEAAGKASEMLAAWQRTQSAPVSQAERLPLESLEPLHRPVPSGWAVKRPAIDARYVDNYLGPLDGWLQDPRRAVLFGNKEAAIAVQAALSVDSKLPISVVWLVYDPVFDTYREQAQ